VEKFHLKITLLGFLLLSSSAFASPLSRFFKPKKDPSPAIRELAQKASMNNKGQDIFFDAEPELLEKAPFSEACNKHEGAGALGCYNGEKIFLFQIKESQLEYMIPLTAAHEMLHAAYEELSRTEKQNIDALLETVRLQITDPQILEKFDEYKTRDASVLPSEVHSIIGTEVENLPASLEAHYAKYFVNRKALVKLSQNYYGDIRARRNVLKTSEDQLDVLKKDIDLRQKVLKAKQSHLEVLKKHLEENSSAENARSFNQLAEQFNAEVKVYQDLINTYNSIAKERNSKAKESKELYEALDSKI
jgi:hypothetical protein